ncbi:MAG: tetratricopeptide repeat protein [Bryobacterales bacterium]|nr:tetratricopeptide repeat protein [Bryobacterales bacterium]MBV9400452.1 tetratricopeptide repeat protein [Bryobacterales bacterium]
MATSPGTPLDPTAFIPVTAEDAARRKRRIVLAWITAVLVLTAAALWLLKRWTDPIRAEQTFHAGRQLMDAARYNEAILTFDRVISLQPSLAEAWVMRGRAHIALYATEAAIDDFTKAIHARPRNPRPLVERGQAYLALKNYSAAIEDASAAANIDPDLSAAYNLRGVAVRETGDARKALEDFNRAVQLAPSADNYFQRGATYVKLGDYARAIADFTRTIAFQPDLAQAYYARAQAERDAGDLKSAEADHLRGRKLDGQ